MDEKDRDTLAGTVVTRERHSTLYSLSVHRTSKRRLANGHRLLHAPDPVEQRRMLYNDVRARTARPRTAAQTLCSSRVDEPN